MTEAAVEKVVYPDFGFSIDSSSDNETCHDAVESLKRLIELGKSAQSALDSIEKTGFYEGVSPIAMDESTGWIAARNQKVNTVRFAVFQKRQSFSRTDLPELDNLQLVYGCVEDALYSGHPCKTVDISIKGLVARQIDKYGAVEFEEHEQRIGMIRINKNHLSFITGTYSSETAVIYKTLNTSPKSDKGARIFANCLAGVMVDVKETLQQSTSLASAQPVSYTTRPDFEFCAKMQDLRTAAPQWFIDDGVVQRMFSEIHKMMSIVEVMGA